MRGELLAVLMTFVSPNMGKGLTPRRLIEIITEQLREKNELKRNSEIMGLCYWEIDVIFGRNWRVRRAEVVEFGKEGNAFALQGTEF